MSMDLALKGKKATLRFKGDLHITVPCTCTTVIELELTRDDLAEVERSVFVKTTVCETCGAKVRVQVGVSASIDASSTTKV